MKMNDALETKAVASVSMEPPLAALPAPIASPSIPQYSRHRIKRSRLVLGLEVLLAALSYALSVAILSTDGQRVRLLATLAFPLVIAFRFVGLY